MRGNDGLIEPVICMLKYSKHDEIPPHFKELQDKIRWFRNHRLDSVDVVYSYCIRCLLAKLQFIYVTDGDIRSQFPEYHFDPYPEENS